MGVNDFVLHTCFSKTLNNVIYDMVKNYIDSDYFITVEKYIKFRK